MEAVTLSKMSNLNNENKKIHSKSIKNVDIYRQITIKNFNWR